MLARSSVIRETVRQIRAEFESKFLARFCSDITTNRNLIRRFADTIKLAQLYSSLELNKLVCGLGLANPVYCGPIISHYTHGDIAGGFYGLPWHQDYPSMASSSNAVIVWVSVSDCNTHTHSIEVAPGEHTRGLLEGSQTDRGYILSNQSFAQSMILEVAAGDLVVFSPFLPHRTFVNFKSTGYKLSFSRRFDDLECANWEGRKYVNAYSTYVDRDLYRSARIN